MKLLNPVFRSIKPAHLAIAIHLTGFSVAVMIVIMGYSLLNVSQGNNESEWLTTIQDGSRLIEQREALVAMKELNECELFDHTVQLEELNALIPYRPESSRFLAQLAELADGCELNIQNFRPGTAEQSESLQRIRVLLTGTGSWQCVCRFIHGLHALPRLTRITKLQIDPLNSEQNYPVQMELSIFFAAEDNTVTRIARNGQ